MNFKIKSPQALSWREVSPASTVNRDFKVPLFVRSHNRSKIVLLMINFNAAKI